MTKFKALNAPKVSNLLVMVSNSYKEVSKQNKVYYKLEFSVIARKEETGEWYTDDSLSMVRMSEDGYKAFSMQHKWTLNNVVLLDVAEHIKGVTEYIKDDVLETHGENGVEVVSVIQANSLKLLQILPEVNLMHMKPELDKDIQLAVNRSAMLSARTNVPSTIDL